MPNKTQQEFIEEKEKLVEKAREKINKASNKIAMRKFEKWRLSGART